MKKKLYEKPDTRAVEIQTEAFIATSNPATINDIEKEDWLNS